MAFAILIGGLLLDVLISVSLGVSALPVNIIIGNSCIFLEEFMLLNLQSTLKGKFSLHGTDVNLRIHMEKLYSSTPYHEFVKT